MTRVYSGLSGIHVKTVSELAELRIEKNDCRRLAASSFGHWEGRTTDAESRLVSGSDRATGATGTEAAVSAFRTVADQAGLTIGRSTASRPGPQTDREPEPSGKARNQPGH